MSAFRLGLLAASALSFAVTASAQTANNVLLDEVIVTATKSADVETVQDVAVAVTAFNDDTLDALNIRDIEGLSFSAPNVSLDDIGTTRGTANFSIRGLGVNSSIPSIDPTVGVFVDGVYLGINAGVVFDQFDLESVELLRGPQGILFGRNTTGGAVLLNTKRPTEDFEASARIAVESPLDGDRGGLNKYVMGSVSGPIIEDKVLGKIAAYHNDDDGYFQNLFNGEDFGAADTTIVRAALEFRLAPELTNTLRAEIFTSDGDGPAAQNRGLFERDSFDFAVNREGFYENDAFNITNETRWDVAFGGGEIVNIFGYRTYEAATRGDIDALPDAGPIFENIPIGGGLTTGDLIDDLFFSDTLLEQEQISNELRYSGTFGAVTPTVGVYYFNQDLAYDEIRFLPFLQFVNGNQNDFYGGGQQEHQVWGAFANLDFALNDMITLSGGLRYTEETKDANVSYVIPRAQPCSVVASTCPFAGTGFSDSDSWSNLNPKVGVTFEPNSNLLTYAQWTRGNRSGGYNFRITNPAAFLTDVAARGGQIATDEEVVDSYEIGAKYTSPDRRIVLNAAGFLTDISDLQREVNVGSPTTGVFQNILNTADAEILGIEVEGRFALTDYVTLTGNVGWLDDDYTDIRADISGDGVINDADFDLRLPRVPEITYGLGAVASFADAFTANVNWQYRDEVAYTDNNLGFIQDIHRVDANLSWATPVEGVTLSVYGKNLLDEVQAGGDTQLSGAFGGPLSTGQVVTFADQPTGGTFSPLKKGRVFGVELDLEF